MDFRNTKFKRALAALSAAVMGAALIAPTAAFADDEGELTDVLRPFDAGDIAPTISEMGTDGSTVEAVFAKNPLDPGYSIKGDLDRIIAEHQGQFFGTTQTDYTLAVMDWCWSDTTRFGSAAVAKQKFEAMAAKADEIVAGIDPAMSDLSKIIYVNEYLVNHCKYNITVGSGGKLSNHQVGTAYNCLVLGDAVCQGYAEAFWYLMYKMDIDCRIIVSSDDLNHAWNIVQLNNKWYQVDSTWNDAMIGDSVGDSEHDHLLKSDSYFLNNGHACDSWYDYYIDPYCTTSAYGKCTDTSYDNRNWNYAYSNISIVNNNYYYIDSNTWTVNRMTAAGAVSQILDLTDVCEYAWPVTNMENYTYNYYFGGLAVYKNKLIFSDTSSIYCTDLDGSNPKKIYTLTAAQKNNGYISGNLILDGSTITYGVSPNYDLQYQEGFTSAQWKNRKMYKYTLDLTKYVSTSLAKPTVKATAGNGRVALSWNAVSGASKYRVFYRLNGAAKWTTVDTTATARTITGLTNGKAYQFLVRATDGTNWSTYTNADIVTATPKAAAAVKPTISSITPGVDKVVIRWNAVSGAKSYRVYYRYYGTSKWSYKNTSVNAMNLTGLTGGRTYEFLVRSYNGSTWSAYTSADIKRAKPTAAAKPTITSVTAGTGRAVVRWNAVSGAQSYRVYYRVYGTSAWSYKNTTVNAMNVTGLRSGKTYEFLVRSYSGSTWSAYTSADIRKASIA